MEFFQKVETLQVAMYVDSLNASAKA